MRRSDPTTITKSTIFQSTHPLRDATYVVRDDDEDNVDFNPRTPYGMRHSLIGKINDVPDFNPRTPYGMRQCASITLYRNGHFNPRTPYGMRPSIFSICIF